MTHRICLQNPGVLTSIKQLICQKERARVHGKWSRDNKLWLFFTQNPLNIIRGSQGKTNYDANDLFNTIMSGKTQMSKWSIYKHYLLIECDVINL